MEQYNKDYKWVTNTTAQKLLEEFDKDVVVIIARRGESIEISHHGKDTTCWNWGLQVCNAISSLLGIKKNDFGMVTDKKDDEEYH